MIDSPPLSGVQHDSPGSESGRRLRLIPIAAVIAVYGLLAVLLVFVTPGLFGFHTYTGVGESMGDAIPSGSLIVTKSVSPNAIEVGDVIEFRWPGFDLPITHRVIDIRSRDGTPLFVTKGDGNRRADPYLTVGDENVDRVIFDVPRLGAWLPYVKALIYLAAFAGAFLLWRRARARRLARQRAADGEPPATG